MATEKLIGPMIELGIEGAALVGRVGDPFMDNCIE